MNYANAAADSAFWIRKGDPIASPFTVQTANGEQRITITATPSGPQGIVMRNDALDPDGVVAMQMSVDGKAQIQTISGITELLDPIVNVGNGLQNAQLNIKGAAGSVTKIEQVGDRSRITNPKEVTTGGMQFFASTNSVQYILAPRDKDAAIQIYNSSFFTSSRSTEIGLSEAGVGYIRVNGGTEFVIQEPTVRLGDGVSGAPQVLVSGLPGEGRVYDTRFNKPYNLISTFKTASNVLSAQETFSLTLQPGTYQLQSVARLEQDGNVQFGQGIECWIQRNVSPNLYRDYSEIHLMSTMMIVPSLGESNTPSFVSGTFEIPQEDTWFIYANPVGGSWNFGTIGSSWLEFQIVKVA